MRTHRRQLALPALLAATAALALGGCGGGGGGTPAPKGPPLPATPKDLVVLSQPREIDAQIPSPDDNYQVAATYEMEACLGGRPDWMFLTLARWGFQPRIVAPVTGATTCGSPKGPLPMTPANFRVLSQPQQFDGSIPNPDSNYQVTESYEMRACLAGRQYRMFLDLSQWGFQAQLAGPVYRDASPSSPQLGC